MESNISLFLTNAMQTNTIFPACPASSARECQMVTVSPRYGRHLTASGHRPSVFQRLLYGQSDLLDGIGLFSQPAATPSSMAFLTRSVSEYPETMTAFWPGRTSMIRPPGVEPVDTGFHDHVQQDQINGMVFNVGYGRLAGGYRSRSIVQPFENLGDNRALLFDVVHDQNRFAFTHINVHGYRRFIRDRFSAGSPGSIVRRRSPLPRRW